MNPYDILVQDIMERVDNKLKSLHAEIAETIRKVAISRIEIPALHNGKPPKVEACHKQLRQLLETIAAKCWPCLVGPTGSGKTLAAIQAAKALGIENIVVRQMSRMTTTYDLLGFIDAGGTYRAGAWYEAIKSNQPAMIILDELDNGNENINMLVKGLALPQIQMPYGKQDVNPHLIVVATMNTWGNGATREYVGRCAQDVAMLNEFTFIEWNYDEGFELTLMNSLFDSIQNKNGFTAEHISALHKILCKVRQNANEHDIRVVVSTRNMVAVTKLVVMAKWKVTDAVKAVIIKDAAEDEAAKLLAGCDEIWKQSAKKSAARIQTTDTNEECPI